MATWIVGGILFLLVASIVWKMLKNKREHKGGCSCGSCKNCPGVCHQ